MAAKRNEGKFTLQFNQDDPVHRSAIAKLNSLPRNKKANYLALAIEHFENYNPVIINNESSHLKTLLKNILKGVLTEADVNSVHIQTASMEEENSLLYQPDTFSKKSHDAINDALDMFNV